MSEVKDNNTASESTAQDNSFSAFGFSKVARRNFVIAIVAILISSNAGLFRYTMVLNEKINAIREAQADSSLAMYNRLVSQIALKMEPVKQQVHNIQENIEQTDSLQNVIIRRNKLNIAH